MTEMLLQKEDVIREIEAVCSEILGSPHHIQTTFQKKEDYFASQLLA